MDFGDASVVETRGKLTVSQPPIFISSMPPGCNADEDEKWQQIYGASHDAFLAIFDGSTLQDNILEIQGSLESPYSDALFTAANSNLYDTANDSQQIQMVVSKTTVEEARSASSFGGIDEARTIGLRAPAHMAGWGRTVGLRPTDPDPEDSRINDNLHKMDRSTWKVGPVDIPWDSRRNVWSAYNYLIADHEDKNLGTFVFSTNPDTNFGFPNLRGKLEDVLAVRRTDSSQNPLLASLDDTTKTAQTCLLLESNILCTETTALGQTANVVGNLSNIFCLIHHGEDEIITAGSEQTIMGGLEISTYAFFHHPQEHIDAHGPLSFGGPLAGATIDIEDGEVPLFIKLVPGMGLLGTPAWAPVVNFQQIIEDGQFNLCQLPQYAVSMSLLTKNSETLADDGIFALECNVINWHEEYNECIKNHIDDAIARDQAILDTLAVIGPYVKSAMDALANNLWSVIALGIGGLAQNVQDAVTIQLIPQIQACFAQLEVVCPLTFGMQSPSLGVVGINLNDFDVPTLIPEDCEPKSFNEWRLENNADLHFSIINPCTGSTALSSTC